MTVVKLSSIEGYASLPARIPGRSQLLADAENIETLFHIAVAYPLPALQSKQHAPSGGLSILGEKEEHAGLDCIQASRGHML